MKTVHLYMEDEQYKKLIKVKKDMSWIEFIMQLTEE